MEVDGESIVRVGPAAKRAGSAPTLMGSGLPPSAVARTAYELPGFTELDAPDS